MSRAHQKSILPLQDMMQVIDSNTTELFHYDISPNGIKGTKPIDDLYDDSLVCWLDTNNLNLAGTYVVDKSRYGNHGKLNGLTTANGIDGKALYFVGTIASYIKLTNAMLTNTTDFTLLLKAKFNNLSKSINSIFHATITGGNDLSVEFYSDRITIVLLGSVYVFNMTNVIDTWYDIVIQRAGDQLTIYKDSVLISTLTCITTAITITGAIIVGQEQDSVGGSFDASQAFEGTMQSIRLYTRALSQVEISSLYNKSIYSLRSDGKYGKCIALEEATDNLWNGLTSTGSNGGWSIIDNPFTSCPFIAERKVIKCTPRSYMNYWTLNNTDAATYPTGSIFTVQCWCYVDLDSDNVGAFRICGESRTSASVSYDKTKLGTWQHLQFTVTSTGDGFYFLLYANSGTGSSTWTRGNVYYANVQVEAKSYPTSYINGSRERGMVAYKNPLNEMSVGTISCFAKKLPGHQSGGSIISIGSDTSIANSLYINVLDDKVTFTIYDVEGAGWPADFPTVTDSAWHMYTMIFDGSSIYGYIDGVKVTTAGYLYGGFIPDGYLRLAQRVFPGYSPNRFGSFLIDELRIDKVVRTDEEILSWYLSNCPFYGRGSERVIL